MKIHIHIIHEGQKDYKCETCDKLFSEGASLKRHIHTIHEGDKDEHQEKHNCEICGRSFT